MNDDPIVEEIRQARQKIFAEEGYDLGRLLDRLRREQQAHPERLVSFPSQWSDKSKSEATVSS